MKSVLQDWVMELPLREQGTLLTCVRGCDLPPKSPLDSPERKLVAALRFAFMVPADPREIDAEVGSFMTRDIPTFKPSALGHYPLHWVTHIMHAAEVIAYRHPNNVTQRQWFGLYAEIVHSLHLPVEQFSDFVARMGEDRIARGNIVS